MEKWVPYVIVAIVIVVVIFGILIVLKGNTLKGLDDSEEGNRIEKITNFPISVEKAKEIRLYTYDNCLNLLDKHVNFSGTVLLEECSTNCLGGCPGQGPDWCYYGVRDENGCIVYFKSKKASWTPPGGNPIAPIVFNEFEFGQNVNISGTITQYINYLCNRDNAGGAGVVDSNCVYFVIGGL